jgi:hypothetical protein
MFWSFPFSSFCSVYLVASKTCIFFLVLPSGLHESLRIIYELLKEQQRTLNTIYTENKRTPQIKQGLGPLSQLAYRLSGAHKQKG